MSRRWLCVLMVGVLFPACRKPDSGLPRVLPDAAAPPYPIAPLLAALRPDARGAAARSLGSDALTDLPFYELELEIRERAPAPARGSAALAAPGAGAGELQLQGRYRLHYKNRTGRPMDRLPLLLHPNTPRELGAPPSSGTIEVTAARAAVGPAVRLERRRLTLVELVFQRPVRIGERVELEVSFRGRPRRLPEGSNDLFSQALSSLGMSSSGAGASDYGLLAEGDGLLTIASAYPMAAPFRNGAFDTSPPTRFGDLAYNDLAHFQVRVRAPRGMTVVTNLLDRGLSGGEHHAVGAANRDLVVVAGKLRHVARRVGPVQVRSFFLEGDSAGGHRAADAAARSLELFQRLFGPYPYTELDVAEASLVGGAGGVEFPGMVLIAGMLYRPPSASSSPLGQILKLAGGLGRLLGGGGGLMRGMSDMDRTVREMAEFTVAHEVAHQYFAGLIGTDCRADPAVDEPLAQYAAGRYVLETRGPAEGARQMSTNVRLNYGVYRMIGGPDLPAQQPVREFPSPLAYAAIVYGKAPYYYVTLRERLGPARLDGALRRAVDENQFKLVTLETWLQSLERAAGGPSSGVRALARRWFHETHGDEDLGVDDSGESVLAELVGREQLEQLKQSLSVLGMRPRDLFRTLLGQML